jgi:hypothetical protein
MADSYVRRIFNVSTGLNTRYAQYPAATGVGTAGVSLSANAGSYGALANFTTSSAAEIWVCGEGVFTASGAGIFDLAVVNTTLSSTLFTWSLDTTAVSLNVTPFMVPLPIYCAAGSQIQGKAGGTVAKTINAYLIYATGL